MTCRTQRQHGFTLIELLVVIAVITIVAAILFPVFSAAREKARQVSCISSIQQLGKATMLYAQDCDETYPLGLISCSQRRPLLDPSGTRSRPNGVAAASSSPGWTCSIRT